MESILYQREQPNGGISDSNCQNICSRYKIHFESGSHKSHLQLKTHHRGIRKDQALQNWWSPFHIPLSERPNVLKKKQQGNQNERDHLTLIFWINLRMTFPPKIKPHQSLAAKMTKQSDYNWKEVFQNETPTNPSLTAHFFPMSQPCKLLSSCSSRCCFWLVHMEGVPPSERLQAALYVWQLHTQQPCTEAGGREWKLLVENSR